MTKTAREVEKFAILIICFQNKCIFKKTKKHLMFTPSALINATVKENVCVCVRGCAAECSACCTCGYFMNIWICI